MKEEFIESGTKPEFKAFRTTSITSLPNYMLKGFTKNRRHIIWTWGCKRGHLVNGLSKLLFILAMTVGFNPLKISKMSIMIVLFLFGLQKEINIIFEYEINAS